MVRELGAGCLRFVDTNLTSDAAYIKRLCRGMIGEGLRVPWSCFARADELARDPELCSLMAESGCFWVYAGAESSDPGILERMGKGFGPAEIAASVRNVKRAGMAYHANFVVGLPGETSSTLAAERDFIISSGMDTVSFTVLGVTGSMRELADGDPGRFGGLSGSGHAWRHSGMDYAGARYAAARLITEIASRDDAPLVASHGIGMYYLMGGGEDFAGVLAYFTAVRDWHRATSAGDASAAAAALERVRLIYGRTASAFALQSR